LIAVLVVALGAAAGFAVGRSTGDDTVTTNVVTSVTTTVQSATLPPAVDRTRRRILAAARAHDWQALRRIIGGKPIRYTFGSEVPGGPIAFWQRAERQGGRPIETLAAIMALPYTLSHGIYFWPFAYTTPPDQLTSYEIGLLAPFASRADVAKWKAFGGYFGYRAGIAPDGTWQLYVSGD
jgi:hypothetical protein